MKKLIAISICLVLFFTFVGCSNVEQQNEVAKAAFQEEDEPDFESDGQIPEIRLAEHL